jgi:osmotically inducible lipoprotein OsmB
MEKITYRIPGRCKQLVVLGTALAVAGLSGCSSVAPSKTATGAGTGAMIGGAGGAVVGSSSSMGTGTGLVGGAAAGALIGGIVGMVQDAKDRKEQDRLAQERAYQQELAKRRAEDARSKASIEEELAVAAGLQISDIELNDARRTLEQTNDRLKRLRDERAAALAKKKELDESFEKTLAAEAEIARLEEELARLKGDEGFLSYPAGPRDTPQPAVNRPAPR